MQCSKQLPSIWNKIIIHAVPTVVKLLIVIWFRLHISPLPRVCSSNRIAKKTLSIKHLLNSIEIQFQIFFTQILWEKWFGVKIWVKAWDNWCLMTVSPEKVIRYDFCSNNSSFTRRSSLGVFDKSFLSSLRYYLESNPLKSAEWIFNISVINDNPGDSKWIE